MAITQKITGALVFAAARSYESFTTPDGETKPGGVIREAMLSQDFSSEPARLRFADESLFGEVEGAAFGDIVEVTGVVKGVGAKQYVAVSSVQVPLGVG